MKWVAAAFCAVCLIGAALVAPEDLSNYYRVFAVMSGTAAVFMEIFDV